MDWIGLDGLGWTDLCGFDGWFGLQCNGLGQLDGWISLHGLNGFGVIGLGGSNGGIGLDLIGLHGPNGWIGLHGLGGLGWH